MLLPSGSIEINGRAVVELTLGSGSANVIQFTTANDNTKRDPVSWTVEGSNSCSGEWSLLQTFTEIEAPTGRRTDYTGDFAIGELPDCSSPPPSVPPPSSVAVHTLRFTITQNRENDPSKGVQLSELRVYDSDGTQLTVASISNPGGSRCISSGCAADTQSVDKLIDNNIETKWFDGSSACKPRGPGQHRCLRRSRLR